MHNEKHTVAQKIALLAARLTAWLCLIFATIFMAGFTWIGLILYQKEVEMDKTAITLEAELLKTWSERKCSGNDCKRRRYVSYRYKHPEKGWMIKKKKTVNNILYWNALQKGQAKFELEGGIVEITPIINQITQNLGFEKSLPTKEWTTRIKGENSKIIYLVMIIGFGITFLTCLYVILGQFLKFLRPEREVL